MRVVLGSFRWRAQILLQESSYRRDHAETMGDQAQRSPRLGGAIFLFIHSFIHSFFLSFFLSLSFNVFFPFFCKAFNPEQMISIQIISQAPGLLSDPLRCQWLRSLVCKRSRIPILKRSLGRRWHGRCHFSNSQQPEPTHMA